MYCSSNLNVPPGGGYEEETIPVLVRWFGSWQISLRRRVLSAHELSRSYDRAAPRWSRTLDRLGFPDAYDTLLRGVLGEEAPGINGSQRRVLDCGVGTGALSCALARVSPAPFKLDAIDISPCMLEQARSSFRDCNLKGTLRLGDIRKLPYGDSVFDLVMSAHVLEHLANPSVALNEMIRVLKPGGLLVTSLTRRSWLGMYVNLKWRTHRVTPDQAEVWLDERGLKNVHCLSFGNRPFCRQMSVACVGRKPLGEIHAGVRAVTSVQRDLDLISGEFYDSTK